jgi:hypothetical protein
MPVMGRKWGRQALTSIVHYRLKIKMQNPYTHKNLSVQKQYKKYSNGRDW